MLIRGNSGSFLGGGRGYITPVWLLGLSRDQLSELFQSLQKAMIELKSGAKVTNASYAQGDGSKSVTFAFTSQAQLINDMNEVARALGYPVQSRTPLRPYYR